MKSIAKECSQFVLNKGKKRICGNCGNLLTQYCPHEMHEKASKTVNCRFTQGSKGKDRGGHSKGSLNANTDMVFVLKSEGKTFKEIGKRFKRSPSWASNLFYKKQKELSQTEKANQRLLGQLVEGLKSCPKVPPLEKSRVERLKGRTTRNDLSVFSEEKVQRMKHEHLRRLRNNEFVS